MADLTVSADIDTFMGAVNFAAARISLGAASLGANTFTGQQLVPPGSVAAPGLAFSNDTGTGLHSPAAGNLVSTVQGLAVSLISASTFVTHSTMVLGWTNGSAIGAPDAMFRRVQGNNIGVGRLPSATPVTQIFTIGESTRSGTDVDVAGGIGVIRCGLGTGAAAVPSLQVQVPTPTTAGSGAQPYTVALTINNTGVTSAGNIVSGAAGTHAWTGRTTMLSSADGVLQLTNNAQNDFSRLIFGGTGAASPALKKGVAQLICRLADDSANALFVAGAFQTDAPVGGSSSVWRLGTVASVTPTSPNRTIEVEIAGTTYYLAAKTTNN